MENKKNDRYQEYADANGMTRKEAKSIMFGMDYGRMSQDTIQEITKGVGPTGLRDMKAQLRKLFVGDRKIVCDTPDSES